MQAGEGGVSSSNPPPISSDLKTGNNRMTRKVLTISAPKEQGVKVDEYIPKRCDTCRFYEAPTGVLAGECRRRSPYFKSDGDLRYWPPVAPDMWCGEYKRLPVQVS